MGCWNKTCGLTGLHIFSGEKVMVFAMEQTSYHDRCYTTAFWNPVLLPFYSEYNDYGGGENSHGIGLELLIKGLKTNLVEREVGENKYHDIAVKRNEFNESLFFESVHEGRLATYDHYAKKESMVDFVMFREDVVNDILTNFRQQDYVGHGKGSCGYDNSYINYGFQDVLADLPEFVAALKDRSSTNTNDLPYVKFDGCRSLFAWDHPNKAAKFLRRTDHHRNSSLISPFSELVDFIVSGENEKAEELLVDWLKASYLDSFMNSTRKVWMPGAHEGSQNQEHHGYRVLANAINSALDREKEDYLRENDCEWSDM